MKKFIKTVFTAIFIFIIICVLLLFGLFKACSYSPKSVTANIGETITYQDKEITVNYIELTDYINNNEKSDDFLKPTDGESGTSWRATQGRIFLTVSYTVKNIGENSTSISKKGTVYYENGDNNYQFNTDEYLYSRMGTNTWKNWYGELKPLSNAEEFRTYFAVPAELRDNPDGSVTYEIFNHKYTVR